jgi:4-amino-4-deoxy-L-arabinose transferase-like glycosyltransferase
MPSKPYWRHAAVFAVLLATVVCLQWRNNAYHAEFVTQGDEAAHMVTGTMVYDYLSALLSGNPGSRNPMRYAETYYVHYPQVALGHWPPGFYGFQAAWLFVAPHTRASFLFLVALFTAILCFRIYQAASAYAPWQAAAAAGLLAAILAPIQFYTMLFLAETLTAWLIFEAVLAFAKWMRGVSGPSLTGWKTSALFGLWCSAAILTKALGAAVGLLPLTTIALARRFGLLLRPSLWLAPVIVLGLCTPWYIFAPGARHEANVAMGGMIGVKDVSTPGGSSVPTPIMVLPEIENLTFRTRISFQAITILFDWLGPVLVLAVWGAWRRARDGDTLAWSVLGVVVAFAAFRFLLVAAAAQPRLLLPAMPPLLIFLWDGCVALRERMRPAVALAVVFGLAAVWSFANVRAKENFGIEQTAAALAFRPEFRDSVFLVASDANSEASFVSEMVLRERSRPDRYILRSSKILATSYWNGQKYEAKVADPAGMMRLLEEIPVGVFVVDDDTMMPSPYIELVRRTVEAYPQKLIPVPLPGKRFRAFEVAGQRGKRPNKISMRLHGLGRDLGQ